MNTDAGILDGKLRHLVAVFDLQRHVTAVGELDGVGDQIDQHLAKPVLVRVDHVGQGLCREEAEGDALVGGLQPKHVDQLVEKLAQTHFLAIELEAAGFDLRDIEQTVD